MAAGKDVTPEDERDTERLKDWYKPGGEGGARIQWGTPNDFYRCVALAGRFMGDPQGYCAKLHHEVLGIWPATHAKLDREGEGVVKHG